MAATAAQNTQKKAEEPKYSAPQRKDAPKQKGAGLKDKLYNLPQVAGVAIMAVLLIASLFIGNFRALQNATPKDFMRWGDVDSIVEERIDAAENILTVAGRAGLNANAIHAAEGAVAAMKEADSAQEISRADQDLMAAISELTTAELSGEEARNMLSAADAFAEYGSFLRQEARAYNEKAQKAEALYEKLPTKFVLPEPDVYEGI